MGRKRDRNRRAEKLEKKSAASSTRAERVISLITRLQDSAIDVGTKKGLRSDTLHEMVAEDHEVAAGAVIALLHAADHMRGSRQIALAVAAAYQNQTGDDSLARKVERALEAAGEKMPAVLEVDDGGQLGPVDVPARPISLRIDKEMLAKEQLGRLPQFFNAEDAEDLERLKAMRGRCMLSFDLDDDPRPVWEIPEARALVHKLFEEIRYFPYFLDMRQEAGGFMVFFGCLADPVEAFEHDPSARVEHLGSFWARFVGALKKGRQLRRRQGLLQPAGDVDGVYNLNVMHPTVFMEVAKAVVGIATFCQVLGEDPEPQLSALLAPYPESIRRDIQSKLVEQLQLPDFHAGVF